LSVKALNDALQSMHNERKYSQLLFYIKLALFEMMNYFVRDVFYVFVRNQFIADSIDQLEYGFVSDKSKPPLIFTPISICANTQCRLLAI
jgi:hypothetical protein